MYKYIITRLCSSLNFLKIYYANNVRCKKFDEIKKENHKSRRSAINIANYILAYCNLNTIKNIKTMKNYINADH